MSQSSLNNYDVIKQQLDFVQRLCELEEYSQAESYLKNMVRQRPNNAQVWYALSFISAQQRNLPRAVELLKKAIELDPHDASFYSSLGNLYTNQKQFDLAIECYQKAIAIQPEDHSLYKTLGLIYGIQGDMGSANFHYGLAQQKKGDIAEAIKFYRKTIQSEADHALAYYKLGSLYQNRNEIDSAIDCYQQATKLKTDYTDAYYNLGFLYEKKGLLSSAIYNYEQVIKQQPNRGEAYLGLSLLYQKQGDLTKAFQACQNALQYQAKKANASYLLNGTPQLPAKPATKNSNGNDRAGKAVTSVAKVNSQQLKPQQLQQVSNSVTTKSKTSVEKAIAQQLTKTDKLENLARENTPIEKAITPTKSELVEVATVREIKETTESKNNSSAIVLKQNNPTIFKQKRQQQLIINSNNIDKKKNLKQDNYDAENNFTFDKIEKELISHRILDNQYNFIVTTFFPESHLKIGLRFLDYLAKTDFSYCLYQTPQLHQSSSTIGKYDRTSYTKPNYFASVYHSLQQKEFSYNRKTDFTHLLYLDYRLLFSLGNTAINFMQNICDRDVDFATYNCLFNSSNPRINRAEIEANLLYSSGKIQLYSLSAKSLLIWQTWQQLIEQYLNVFDPQTTKIFPEDRSFLDYAWNQDLRHKSQIRYAWFSQKHLNYHVTPLTKTLYPSRINLLNPN